MSLILFITTILHGIGNIFVLYSDFFVIQVLVDINNNGVYGSDIIKKGW